MSEEVLIEDPKAVLAALARAKEDAKRYREELEAMQAEFGPIKEELDSLRGEIKTNAIKRAVAETGADPDRVLQFLKTEDIEYKDGKLEGFDDNFKSLKTALPELFDPKRRVGGKVELETDGKVHHQKSVSELQAEKLLQLR